MKSRLGQALAMCALALLAGLVAAMLHSRRPPWTWDALRFGALWVELTPLSTGVPTRFPEALRPTAGDWDGFLASVLERWNPGQPVMVRGEGKHSAEAEVVARRLREAGLDRVYVLRDSKR